MASRSRFADSASESTGPTPFRLEPVGHDQLSSGEVKVNELFRNSLFAWKDLEVGDFLIGIVAEGYKLPLYSTTERERT